MREKTISLYCPFNSSNSRKVSDSELEWLERDVTQMMDKDGPGAKTQTLFQVYHLSLFVFDRMGPVSGCLFRQLARSELKLNVHILVSSSCCESGIRCLFDPESQIRNRFFSGSRILNLNLRA